MALGVVSFFTDLSAEMIYPLLPAFLATTLALGKAAPAILGLIEGLAESVASVLKVAGGVWSDHRGTRKPLVVLGYSISSAARPLVGLATAWPLVLTVRLADRVGKGLRTSPRDALIADVTPPERRGGAYGLHRAMDHAGALVGPLIAALLLMIEGVTLRAVFLLAAIPAAIAVATLVFAVRDPSLKKASPAASVPAPARREGVLASYSTLPRDYKRMLLAVFVFTLGNSADAFFLLRLENAGVAPATVALLWSALHAIKMASTYAGGALSDRVGRKPMVIAGWALFAATYIGFGLIDDRAGLIAIFLVYGLYFGLTEPTERSWVAALAPRTARAGAFGWYHMAVGLGALPASAAFGAVWRWAGPEWAFGMGAAFAVVSSLLLLRVPEPRDGTPPQPPAVEQN